MQWLKRLPPPIDLLFTHLVLNPKPVWVAFVDACRSSLRFLSFFRLRKTRTFQFQRAVQIPIYFTVCIYFYIIIVY